MYLLQVIALVSSKHCQPPPPGCPRPIYHLMVECWYAYYLVYYVNCDSWGVGGGVNLSRSILASTYLIQLA